MLTSLDCSVYFSGQTILESGQPVESVYFISKNSVLLLDARKVFVLRQLYEGSWFGDFNAIFGTQSQFTYIAKTGKSEAFADEVDEEDDTNDDRIMCYLLPKARFLQLLDLYPSCSNWITTRALHRRNYFRNVELTYNMRFGVDSRFDFLKALSFNPDIRAEFDDIIQRRINRNN